MKKKIYALLASFMLAVSMLLTACGNANAIAGNIASQVREEVSQKKQQVEAADSVPDETGSVDLSQIPEFSGKPYVVINGNKPFFKTDELMAQSFESYGNLDNLGRCTAAKASVSQDTMPEEKRGRIGNIKPTGWHTIRYSFINGRYLYNRCHLIGYQLTGENANPKNLITGTRYLNVDGMLPFENMVADYVKETGNHVLYRVTPVFKGNELVARGVLMEAESVEDHGEGIMFNVYCYNNQPGVDIDYATGESQAAR